MQNRVRIALGGLILAAIVGWLAFGYFGVQALFTDDEVSEAGPAFAGGGPGTTLVQGTFSGSTGHSVKGSALVLNDGSSQRVLRLEGFESTNGPDLKVYLRADDDRYVSLGALKGNVGSQNYEIPAEVDLATYRTVQIWCERFGVLFGDAPLA